MGRRMTSITCTCTSTRRCCGRRRCANSWWATKCWRLRSAILRRSRPRLDCVGCDPAECQSYQDGGRAEGELGPEYVAGTVEGTGNAVRRDADRTPGEEEA